MPALAPHRLGDERARPLPPARPSRSGGTAPAPCPSPGNRLAARAPWPRRSSRRAATSCAARCGCGRPAARTTASATNAVRLPSWRSKPSAPKQAPSRDKQPGDVGARRTGMPSSATVPTSVCRIARPGVVAGVARAPPAVGAEEALVEAAVVGAGEGQPQSASSSIAAGASRATDLDDTGVAEAGSPRARVSAKCCCHVSSGSHGAERGVDAARGETVWASRAGPLADDEHLDAGAPRRDRRPQPGAARADDEDARRHSPILSPYKDRSLNAVAHVPTSSLTRFVTSLPASS